MLCARKHRKHRKVSMAKVSEQKPEAESFQHLSALRVASQVPCEPKSPFSKQMWKQKALYEASGVATPQVRPSRKEKGKTPACFDETITREVTTTMMPSPNSGAVTPRASLVPMSEATVSQGTHAVHNREVGTKAPQRAKLALCSEAKGLPLLLIAMLMQLQCPRAFPKLLAANLQPKHCLRLIFFAATPR